MARGRSGTTSIEALVALAVFSVGILGATATMAASLRTLDLGRHTNRLSWRTRSIAGTLQARNAADGRCAALAGGGDSLPGGAAVRWSLLPAAGGMHLLLLASLPPPAMGPGDTAWVFLPCL
jgi:hypothetical protein